MILLSTMVGMGCLARPFPAPKNAIRRTHASVTAPVSSANDLSKKTKTKQFIEDSFQNVYIGAKMR